MTTPESVERASATSHGPHGVHVRVRDHRVTTDRPRDMGGEDRGLMASEHLLVALASCTTTTALKVAGKRKVPLDGVDVDAEMRFDGNGEVLGIHLAVRARSSAPEKDVGKVFDLAERICTISKLLAIEVERSVTVDP